MIDINKIEFIITGVKEIKKKERTYEYLNGLRGYGALAVFIFHVCAYDVRHEYELRRDPAQSVDGNYALDTQFDE